MKECSSPVLTNEARDEKESTPKSQPPHLYNNFFFLASSQETDVALRNRVRNPGAKPSTSGKLVYALFPSGQIKVAIKEH